MHMRNQQQQQKQPMLPYPQFQPPDPAALNSFYPMFTKNSQNNKRLPNHAQQPGKNKGSFNDFPTHGRKQTELQQKQQLPFPMVPTVLRRQPDADKKQLPLALKLGQQGSPQQGPSEFQALWNELHKIQVRQLIE